MKLSKEEVEPRIAMLLKASQKKGFSTHIPSQPFILKPAKEFPNWRADWAPDLVIELPSDKQLRK